MHTGTGAAWRPFRPILLFYAGRAFAHALVFPLMTRFFASATPEGVSMMAGIASYLDSIMTPVLRL